MKILKLTCGEQVMLDDEDYEKIPKSGWYLTPLKRDKDMKRKTRYVKHDKFGFLHRYILNLDKSDTKIVDHIDRNGLNNQKSNLRIVDTLINKRNQNFQVGNKFNFNGIVVELPNNRSPRIRVRWSEGQSSSETHRAIQKTKSFTLSKYNYNYDKCLKDAILFRLQKCRENGYIIDERSTTIENICMTTDCPDLQSILGISYKEIFRDKYLEMESI